MQIKRFEAADVPEALRLVKREFGSDAVILAARELRREKGLFGFMKKPGVEVTAAMDVPVSEGLRAAPRLAASELRAYRSDPYGMPAKKSFMESLQQELKEIGTKLNPLGRKRQVVPSEPGAVFSLRRQLLSQGVEEALAFEILEKVKEIAGADPGLESGGIEAALVRSLRELGVNVAAGTRSKATKKVIALVGPAGVGKTTTLAKLASIHALKHDKAVGLVSLDTYRIGATEALKIYARLLQAPLEIAADKKELKQALARLKDRELVLIDTPGINPRSAQHLDELRGFFDGGLPVEIHLVLSAAAKERDLIETVGRLRTLAVSRLLFTKLDETSTYGAMLTPLVRSKLPLSYLTTSGQPPDGIEIATLERLGALLWGEENAKRVGAAAQEVRGEGMSVFESASRFEEGIYVGTKGSKVFHRETCVWVKKMKAAHMVRFASVTEAQENAYSPCRLCSPGRGVQPVQPLVRPETSGALRQAAVS